MATFAENPHFFLQKYSNDFEAQFIDEFKVKYPKNQWVVANRVYNEMIRDPYHTHLNATRWTSLGEFLIYLSNKSEGQQFMVKREVISGVETDMLLMVDKERLLAQ
jgi:hypothetical protein